MSTPASHIDPLTILICQKSSLTRLHQRVQAVNEAIPPKRFSKTINGQTVEYERRPKAITGSVEATAERLIKDYVKDYHGLVRRVGSEVIQEGLPPLQLCRSKLAQRRTISEKTAYNHLRRLQEAGFITRYRFRGSRHAFEIWLDPALLFQPERTYPQPVVESPEAPANQPRSIASVLSQTANFTAYTVSITQGYLETEKKADGNVHSDARTLKHGDEKHGDPEQHKPTPVSKAGKQAVGTAAHGDGGAGGAAAPVQCGQVDNPRSAGKRAKAWLTKGNYDAQRAALRTDAQRQAILEGYLSSFWAYAKQLLYSARSFAAYEEKLALEAIREGVYRGFRPTFTEKEWDAYQASFYRRLELAAHYYERHPDKWVPEPFALHRPGMGYFDKENTRGFEGTQAWYSENRRNYKKNYEQQQINLYVRHLQLHKVGKAPRALQQLSYTDAYKDLAKRIQRFGPDAQTRFYNLVATLGHQKPKLTIGFTKNFTK